MHLVPENNCCYCDYHTTQQSNFYICDNCNAGPMCWSCMQLHKETCTAYGMF